MGVVGRRPLVTDIARPAAFQLKHVESVGVDKRQRDAWLAAQAVPTHVVVAPCQPVNDTHQGSRDVTLGAVEADDRQRLSRVVCAHAHIACPGAGRGGGHQSTLHGDEMRQDMVHACIG